MDPDKHTFQDQLKLIYKSQDKIPQIIEGLEEVPQQSLKDYYVKLQLIVKADNKNETRYESVDGEKKDITLTEIFDKIANDASAKVPKKLLVLGGAGVGKSTFLQYVAYKWSNNELWENRFDYVYRISLKIILDEEWKSSPLVYESDDLNDSLLKCLAHYCLTINLKHTERMKIKPNMLPWIGSNEGKILLLLDGYDEVAHLQNQNGFKRLFEEIFEFDNLILTSRPNAVKNNIKENFDRIIESTGLDEKGIEEYFTRYFPVEHENKKEELRSFLNKHSVIKDICKIPVNIAMLCYIWLYSESSQHLKEISNVSVLYQEMFNHLGLRYLQKKLEANNSSKKYQLKELWDNGQFDLDEIRVLTHVAFKAMTGGGLNIEDSKRIESLIIKSVPQKDGKIDLQDKDSISIQSSINYLVGVSQIKNTIQDKVTIKQLYKFGLFRTEGAAAVSAKGSSDTDLQKQSFSFIHLTFQEFSTACYFKNQLQKGDDKEKRDICKFLSEHRNDPRYAITLKFMAGIITEDQAKDNHSVVELFWTSMICNVDGMIELGIETKVTLLLNLLGEAVTNKENSFEIDPRVPNKQEIVDFIDIIVLKDILTFHNQLQKTSYLSENIKEGIIRVFWDGTQEWHTQKMKEISERSQPAMKLFANNIIKEKISQSEKGELKQQTIFIQRTIELAISFLEKINHGRYKKEYGDNITKGLTRYLQRLFSDFDENIQLIIKVIKTIKTIILEVCVIDEDFEFKELMNLIHFQLGKFPDLSKEIYELYFLAFSSISKTEYGFECIMWLIKNSYLGPENHNEKTELIASLIYQERPKEFITKLLESFIIGEKVLIHIERFPCSRKLVSNMLKSVDNVELIIQRLKMVETFLESSDKEIKIQAIKMYSCLILDIKQIEIKFDCFCKLSRMLKTENQIERDAVIFAIRLYLFSLKLEAKDDLLMESLKPILHVASKKSDLIDLYLLIIGDLFSHLFKIRWNLEDTGVTLKAFNSLIYYLQSDKVIFHFTLDIESSEWVHDHIKLEGWKANFFMTFGYFIDGGSKHPRNSGQVMAISHESATTFEESIDKTLESFDSLLKTADEYEKLQAIRTLTSMVQEREFTKGKEEITRRILRKIFTQVTEKNDKVTEEAFENCLKLIVFLRDDNELMFQIMQRAILTFFKVDCERL